MNDIGGLGCMRLEAYMLRATRRTAYHIKLFTARTPAVLQKARSSNHDIPHGRSLGGTPCIVSFEYEGSNEAKPAANYKHPWAQDAIEPRAQDM